MMKHKQVDSVKMKKSSCNTVYISFSVYNTDVNIYHVNVFLCCNNTSITLKCQQIHNCDSQMKLHTQMLRTAFQRKKAFIKHSELFTTDDIKELNCFNFSLIPG